jgi:hypothetical protein
MMISVSTSSSTEGLDPGQQEIDTALPQFPKLLQSRLREDHVSGGASGRGNIKAE